MSDASDNTGPSQRRIDRREFLGQAAALAGGALLLPLTARAAADNAKRTAVDQVTLGKTNIKLSRLGFGTGSNGGGVQRELGQEGFTKLLRYAYDQGIRYFDTADNYRGMQPWVGQAIKGLPREKLYIQSKMWAIPDDPAGTLDRFRRELGVEYIDTVLVHAAIHKNWDEERKKVVDALREAREKKIIRAIGVSCHTLPALKRAGELDWLDMALVRFNPQGSFMDTDDEKGEWGGSNASHVPAVVKQVEVMRKKRYGLIGMKLIGNGEFKKPEDREKSVRFAMQSNLLDAAVIGFKSTAEIDEAIERINRALAEPAGPA
jgi:1-deoxyxylulose-5-phosphate synthase